MLEFVCLWWLLRLLGLQSENLFVKFWFHFIGALVFDLNSLRRGIVFGIFVSSFRSGLGSWLLMIGLRGNEDFCRLFNSILLQLSEVARNQVLWFPHFNVWKMLWFLSANFSRLTKLLPAKNCINLEHWLSFKIRQRKVIRWYLFRCFLL